MVNQNHTKFLIYLNTGSIIAASLFALYNLVLTNYPMIYLNLAIALISAISLIFLRFKETKQIAFFLTFCMAFFIVTFSMLTAYKNISRVFWVYPIILFSVYILPLRFSLIFNGLVLMLAFFLFIDPLSFGTQIPENKDKLRFFLSIMLTQVLMYVYEISRKKMEDYITHLAYIDTQTDLFNHHGLIRELENRIKKKEPFALLLIEIQNHNESSSRSGLNDIDVFTKKIIKILKSKNRFLARTNDNSFFYILNTSDKKAVELEGHKIHNSLVKLKNSIPEKQRFTTLSSAVLFDDPKYTPDDLIRFSRIALNESRLSLSQPINIFDETCLESLNRNQKITRLIKRGLKNNEFSIHYQPQIDARDGTLIGVEALLRWIRPSQETISPIELIETAEQSDLIYALGDFAIEKSLEGIQKLNKNYNGNLSIAINLTPRQLLFPNLLALLQRFIKDHHIKPGQIELEISENTLFSHKLQVMRTLRKMKKAGINLLINDFGNSTKNFDYLESYPITAIKINKSMIESIRKRPHRFKTVKLLIESLRTMGIQAIPNGIETLDQVRVLRQLGCSRMQGWYFSKALDLDSMQQFMSSYKPEAIFKKSP